eukprot:scaffold101438_cov66-Cyclotella_meneghiniana.AAC.6
MRKSGQPVEVSDYAHRCSLSPYLACLRSLFSVPFLCCNYSVVRVKPSLHSSSTILCNNVKVKSARGRGTRVEEEEGGKNHKGNPALLGSIPEVR